MLSCQTTPFFPAGLGKALLLFFVIFVIYMTPSKLIVWGDTIPNRYLPFSIIREFNFALDEFVSDSVNEIPYFLHHRNGHFVSSYPIAPAVLAVPFYVIPVLLGMTPESPWMPLLERFSASTIALLSVVFLYLALRRLTTERVSVVVTAIYALCTSTFSVSSQALWQHGPSQLFLSLGLYLLLRGLQEERLIPWSGLALGAAIVSRPTDVLMVLPTFAYLCRYQHKHLLRWFLFSVPPVILLLSYNYFYLGSILDSGYGMDVLQPFSTYWSTPFLYGLFGILLSPGKGLFIYSPILLFALVGIYLVWKNQKWPLLKYLSIGPILVLFLYGKWHFWWGGETYGPRLIADIVPLMCVYLFPVWQIAEHRILLKTTFVCLALLSLLMHTVGAFTFEPSWYKKADVNAESDRLWSWRDSPFLHYGQRLVLKNVSILRTGISALPASPQVPHVLAGSFVTPKIPSHHVATEPIRLSVAAINTGPAIWLFQTSNGQDAIRLGWRWVSASAEMPAIEGRVPLIRDVFPGEQETFNVQIWPPSMEGQHTLELGMVSEPTTWFAVRQFPVQILGNCSFEDVLNEQIEFMHDSPQLTIGTDKPSYLTGEIGKISLNITNGAIARNLRFFIFLKYPDGRLRSINSTSMMPNNPPCSYWVRTSAPHILSRQFKIDWQMGFRLQNMPGGLYTLYTIMNRPKDIKIVAKASSQFRLIDSH